MAPESAGLRLGQSTVERATEAAGARPGAPLAAGRRLGPATCRGWHKDGRGKTCACVSATGVGPPAGPARSSASRYLAGLYDPAELGEQLRRQGGQVGMDRAKPRPVLTSGGNGLEERRRVAFPRAAFIPDFWHAAGHPNGLARARHPQAPEQARAPAAGWCHRLRHEGGTEVLATPEGLGRRGWPAAARESYRLATGCVRDDVHRMYYPQYRKNGWPIGSGTSRRRARR